MSETIIHHVFPHSRSFYICSYQLRQQQPIDASTADVVALDTLNPTQIPEPNDTESSCTYRPNLNMFPFMRNHYQVTILSH